MMRQRSGRERGGRRRDAIVEAPGKGEAVGSGNGTSGREETSEQGRM